MNRRDFLKTSGAVGAGVGLAALGGSRRLRPTWPKGRRTPKNSAGGSAARLTVSTASPSSRPSTRRRRWACTTSKPTPASGSARTCRRRMGADMTAAHRKEVLKKLGDSGVKMVNFGVGGCDRKHFEFAKEMGIETLVAEPNENDFDAIDKLCEEFGINLAIHNHPEAFALLEPRHGAEGLQGPQQTHRGLCRHRPLGPFGPEAARLPQEARRADHQLPLQGSQQDGPGRPRRALGDRASAT